LVAAAAGMNSNTATTEPLEYGLALDPTVEPRA